MASFGDTAFNIRTYVSPKWDRTKRLEKFESRVGIPHRLQKLYGQTSQYRAKSNSVIGSAP